MPRHSLKPAHLQWLTMVTIHDLAGWDAVQAKYFADGGMFDRIFAPGR